MRPTGVGRYSLRLLTAMANSNEDMQIKALVDRKVLECGIFGAIADASSISLVPVDIPPIGPFRDLKYLVQKGQWGKYDVFHCLSSNYPAVMSRKGVVTIHDLKYIRYPRYLGPIWLPKLAYLQFIYRRALSRCMRVIVDASCTRDDILAKFPWIESTKIRVVHLAGQLDFSSNARKEAPTAAIPNEPYFLYVGEQRPHKNLPMLLRAFEMFRTTEQGADHRLVLAGARHASADHDTTALGIRMGDSLVQLGSVTDAELLRLYRHAQALVFVSLYEGFGLPTLEAMAAGIPVLASRTPALMEVGGEACLYADPLNPSDIADKMVLIASDEALRRRLVDKGRQWSASFSWERTASETIAVYREVASDASS